MSKQRLDVIMVERKLVTSRNIAQRMVMAGEVRVNGEVVLKPSTMVPEEAEVTLKNPPRFVSRGGDKLKAALDAFQLDVAGKVCADVGSSTGGFTDCLLQHGAARVYAIDVGRGILDWKLRYDPRVVVMEGVNARYLVNLAEPVELITIDLSFITIKTLLPVIIGWFPKQQSNEEQYPAGEIVTMIKPQFETGRKEAARRSGVIRDPAVHRRVLIDVLNFSMNLDFEFKGLIRSPVRGQRGNIEFLAWLKYPRGQADPISKEELESAVEAVLLKDEADEGRRVSKRLEEKETET